MELVEAEQSQKPEWNAFVAKHFPAVGAFFQTWEWGDFQQALGNNIERYIAKDRDAWLGVLLAVRYKLPLGLEYIYIPRGPVLLSSLWSNEDEARKILAHAISTLQERHPSNIFIRMEPAIKQPLEFFHKNPFKIPSYYIQPRFNTIVDITRNEAEILGAFSPPMRNNVRKAEKKGVRVILKSSLDDEEWTTFRKMREDTSRRAGKNIFPTERYFRELMPIFPTVLAQKPGDEKPHSGIFVAYHDGEPAAINIAIFFAKTATFLFGAAYTRKLVFKISPYIHWASMREAKKLDFDSYDLGGVDQKRWGTLTYFKQQFGGQTLTYMGNVDVVSRSIAYAAYRILRIVLRRKL